MKMACVNPRPARTLNGGDYSGYRTRDRIDRIVGLEMGADDYVTKRWNCANW